MSLVFTTEEDRNLTYYSEIDKVYWVVVEAFGPFTRYTEVPCIFVESRPDGKLCILQFEAAIEHDNYIYTAWRRRLGQVTGRRIDVLLIHQNGDGSKELWRLSTKQRIQFNSLGRSHLCIPASELGRMRAKHSLDVDIAEIGIVSVCGLKLNSKRPKDLELLTTFDQKYLDSSLTTEKVREYHTQTERRFPIVYMYTNASLCDGGDTKNQKTDNSILIGYCQYVIEQTQRTREHCIKVEYVVARGYEKDAFSALRAYWSIVLTQKFKQTKANVEISLEINPKNPKANQTKTQLYKELGFQIKAVRFCPDYTAINQIVFIHSNFFH